MGYKTSLTVVDGGALVRIPRVLAIGAGVSGFARAERAAVRRALEDGMDVLVLSALDEETAEQAFASLSDRVTVRSDYAEQFLNSGLSRRAVRADELAGFVHERNMTLGNTAVIASEPVDRDMLMAAGVAYALETAGYDSIVAADRVCPPRDAGGLVQAIDALLRLRSTIRQRGRG